MVAEINGLGVGAVSGLDQRGTKINESRAADASQAVRGKGADVVTLTDLAARLHELTQSVANIPVADRDKIEQFRQSVADGSYEVDSKAVAEKLTAMESILAQLSRPE